MNFQKLKNNQNSKETIELTQIHGKWYEYLIGTPTPLQTKKSKNPTPSWGEGALVLKPHSVHENGRRDCYCYSLSITALVGPCYCDDFIYVISVPCGRCTQNGDVASAVLMHGMRFEH